MNRENKALKEIEETGILVDYLVHHGLSLDDLKNFSSKMVRKALEWKKGMINGEP